MSKRKPKKQADTSSDDIPPIVLIKTLEDVEDTAYKLLNFYRLTHETLQEVYRLLNACYKEAEDANAGWEDRQVRLLLNIWERLVEGGTEDAPAERPEHWIADYERRLHQAEVEYDNLMGLNISLTHATWKLLPDVWERLEMLPFGWPGKDLDAAERDWKQIVRAAGAERARQERKEKAEAAEGRAEAEGQATGRTPENDAALIYQADASTFYNIPKSTLSKAAKKKPGEPGYLWSGRMKGRVFYRKADLEKISRSRARLRGM